MINERSNPIRSNIPTSGPLLNMHDRAILGDLHRLHVATGMQLQAIHHGTDEAAKQRRIRQLTRLSKQRAVTRLPRRVGGPGGGSFSSIYTLGTTGQRIVDPERSRPRKPWTPSSTHLAHALAVSELYAQLRVAEQDLDIELVEFSVEPDCWRQFSDLQGRATLKPDAHVVVATGEDELHWFVEVDRATETRPRITAKCRLYADYWATGDEEEARGVFPRVLWVVPDDRRAAAIIDAASALDTADLALFEVATFSTATSVLVGLTEGRRP